MAEAMGMREIAPWEHEVKRQEKRAGIRSLEHEPERKTAREIEDE